MNFLKSLTTDALLSQTKNAIKEERLSTLKVLHCFREIEKRKAFLGYSSLYEIAIKHFGYSEAAAHRRISAMRLLRSVPEFEEKFESGALTLTAAASAQSYFGRSKALKAEKVEVLNACLNKSSREVEKEIARREPAADKRPDIRYSMNERVRMSINISEEVFQKLEKLKYQLNFKSIEDVISHLADSKLEIGKTKSSPPAPEVTLRKNNLRQSASRNIPSVTKKIVLKSIKLVCAYKDPTTGEDCKRADHLEFDHIIPFSKGGPHLAENLRLLCSHHNKLAWHTEQKNI